MNDVVEATTQTGLAARPTPKPARVAFGGVGAIFAVITLAALVRSPKSVDALSPPKRDSGKQEETKRDEPERPALASAVASTPRPTATPQRSSAPPVRPPPTVNVSAVMPSSDVKAIIERLDQAFLRNQIPQAIAAVDDLAKLDVTLFHDRKIRDRIIDLAQRVMFSKGEEPQQLFGIIANKMGTNGPDILYEMVTTKGGTRAADLARSLLLVPEVQQKGSEALRIAWELREATCEQKHALFARASKDGDARAYGELNALVWCKKGNCCVKDDKDLDAALAAVRSRMPR